MQEALERAAQETAWWSAANHNENNREVGAKDDISHDDDSSSDEVEQNMLLFDSHSASTPIQRNYDSKATSSSMSNIIMRRGCPRDHLTLSKAGSACPGGEDSFAYHISLLPQNLTSGLERWDLHYICPGAGNTKSGRNGNTFNYIPYSATFFRLSDNKGLP